MNIKNIDNIYITGFENYILYSFKYSPGFAQSYGTVDAQFLSKDGDYSDFMDAPITHDYFQIFFKKDNGDETFLGDFTITAKETREGENKLLQVMFADKSVELDRYLVALRGSMGYDQEYVNKLPAVEQARIQGAVSGNSGRIVWVGKTDSACDEELLSEGGDPCDPCQEKIDDPQSRRVLCEQYYVDNRRNHEYTFEDLVSSLRSRVGINIGIASVNKDMKFDYTGSAREVLNQIGSDMGFSFYYEPQTNSIEFISLANGLKINTKNLESDENKCKIISSSKKVTRENARDVWGNAFFARDAELKSYACATNSCRKLVMSCLTLQDLLPNAIHFRDELLKKPGGDSFAAMEMYSALGYRLGQEVRDVVMWLCGYEINNGKDLEDLKDETLIALNGMEIKAVFHANAADVEKSIYYMLLRTLSSQDYSAVEDIVDDGGYWFLAEKDDEYEEKIRNMESAIASSYLGQYWYRSFNQHWRHLNYSTLSPDGAVTYYDYRSPINLPFADIVYEAFDELERSPLFNSKELDSIAEGEDPQSIVSTDTYFLMQRPGVYWPVKYDDDLLTKLDEIVKDKLFQPFSYPTELTNLFKETYPSFDPKKYQLYYVRKGAGSQDNKTDKNDDVDHPGEVDNVTINVNACGKYTSYGLRSAKTRRFEVKVEGSSMELFMPPQSTEITGKSGYTILLERGGADSEYYVPKAEIFSPSSLPQSFGNGLGIEANIFNATSNDLKYLFAQQTVGQAFCDLDQAGIQSLLKKLTANLSYSFGESEEQSFEIEGFPVDDYSVRDGLRSLNVKSGSNGLSTSIAFDTTFPFQMTVDTMLKKLKYMKLKQLQRPFLNGPNQPDTSDDLETI